MFKISSVLLPVAAMALTGCFGDNNNNGSANNSADKPTVPDSGNHNPFLNMKSENYRLSARLDTVPAIPAANDKTAVTATISPLYRPQGEAQQ